MSRRLFARLVFVLAIVMVGVVLVGTFKWNRTWQGRIYPGVRIDGIGLGGMTAQEAEQKLDQVGAEFLASNVKLVLGEHTWQISRRDLGFTIDPNENAYLALTVGRKGAAWEQARDLWQAFNAGADIPLKTSLDAKKARSMMQSLAKDLYSPPQNARLVVSNDYGVKAIEGRPGKMLYLDASIKALEQSSYPFNGALSLHLEDQQPQVTTQDVLAMKVTGLLATYTTYYDSSNVNRSYNVCVAADALDNNLIKPGEVFSFNRIVGPRSEETGYKEALVIEQNKFTPGIGGGVCQVSSTLYNSVLLSGLEIVERSNHSLPVAYVPLGLDATVAYGYYDLRFRNNTSGYLYIKTRAGDGALTIAILGNAVEKKKIRLDSVVDKVLDFKVVNQDDPSIAQGKTLVETKGVKGYQARSFRVIDGVRTLLSNDVYAPVDEIVHVGTMPVPETPPPGVQKPQAVAPDTAVPGTAVPPSSALTNSGTPQTGTLVPVQ